MPRDARGAPENVLQIEACVTAAAPTRPAAYGLGKEAAGLTLICPSRASTVLGADRLKSLRVRGGTLVGECSWVVGARAYRVAPPVAGSLPSQGVLKGAEPP